MSGHDDERVLRQALADALEGVGKDTGHAIAALRRRAQLNRRMIIWLAILSGALVATVCVMAYMLIEVRSTTSQLDAVQHRTSDRVLCPLYGAFLAAKDNPVPDNIKNNPRQLRERAEAFEVIERGAKELGCYEIWKAGKDARP